MARSFSHDAAGAPSADASCSAPMSKSLPHVAIALPALALALLACSTPSEMPGTDAAVDPFVDADVDAGVPTDAASVVDASSATGSTMIGPAERRARLVAPTSPGTGPAPLLVLLHGYGATGAAQDAYLGVTRAAASRGLWV